MEKIDKSHSKKTLCEIIEIFDLKIADYINMNKKELSKSILYELSKIDKIKEDNDYYFIKDKSELMEYLIQPDPSKSLTVKEKDEVMNLAKFIIIYCNNDFFLSTSPFLDHDDMIKKAKYISAYGDIPSVRKAIDKLNRDPKVKESIELFMTTKCKKKIERKKRLIQKQKNILTIKRGNFVVRFD